MAKLNINLVPTQMIATELIDNNTGQIPGVKANPRVLRDDKFRKLKKSIQDNPKMMALRELMVFEHEGRFVTIGGNQRLEALRSLKIAEAPCKVIPADTTPEQLNAYIVLDNAPFGEWDWDMLANQWDAADLSDWGVDFPQDWANPLDENDEEAIARKEQEFKERMAAGEISEEDEEYQEFLEKFKLKKTTDDCYTPDMVYDAVASWVMSQYDLELKNFVRPFYPGGDYKNYTYPKGCVVVDNPPFSILSEILQFYHQKGIKFFLFAPTLTLFSSSSANTATALPAGATVTYANGATVNTSFLTNLEDPTIRVKSIPSLYRVVTKANEDNLKQTKREIPVYSYPDNIVTSAFMARLSKYGIDFTIRVSESESISQLDSQKDSGKAIYGKGYIVGEKAAAEKAAATRWQLSERELAIIKRLK